ncbi:hypothetical protein NAT51_17610 [Flavobacterium amniphilum]|uniref:hypothetical protein n=1 Tax=Flavobacterium amniphilum TaxID=1834035 RepID=UPI00202AA8ED|nr:hypothetical protein [Flavobacterium amniphilum]MCL9807349.1 hypothetical protein [Flavobacterium amniphilum]
MLMKPVFPFVDYVVNYEYISKVLCENKAKPEMKCNGKCHLMKELAKASEEEKPVSNDKKATHFELETLFIQQLPEFKCEYAGIVVSKDINKSYSDLYHYSGTSAVFHPPTV